MTEEGRVAVLNLLIGSAGVAVLGSLHSAWLKLQPAFMLARRRSAVLVVGLADQDHLGAGSYAGAEAVLQQLLRPGEVFQPYRPQGGPPLGLWARQGRSGRGTPGAPPLLLELHPGLVGG